MTSCQKQTKTVLLFTRIFYWSPPALYNSISKFPAKLNLNSSKLRDPSPSKSTLDIQSSILINILLVSMQYIWVQIYSFSQIQMTTITKKYDLDFDDVFWCMAKGRIQNVPNCGKFLDLIMIFLLNFMDIGERSSII